MLCHPAVSRSRTFPVTMAPVLASMSKILSASVLRSMAYLRPGKRGNCEQLDVPSPTSPSAPGVQGSNATGSHFSLLQHGAQRPSFSQAASPEPSSKIKVQLLVHKVELSTDCGQGEKPALMGTLC